MAHMVDSALQYMFYIYKYLILYKTGGNAHYTSERIIQELICVMSDIISRSIINDMKVSPVFSLLMDETTDVAVMKQLITYGKYLTFSGDTCEVKTAFINMDDLINGKAETIVESTEKFFEKTGLRFDQLSGLGSDGASVMVGKKTGVSTRLREKSPELINIHCMAHRLALASSQTVNEVPYIKKFSSILQQLFYYYQNSSVRMAGLTEIQKILGDPVLKLKEAKSVRWLSHQRAVDSLRRCLPSVIVSLEREASERGDATAAGLSVFMKQYNFIATLYLLSDVLPHLTKLSLLFQRRYLDLSLIDPVLSSTITIISQLIHHEGEYTRSVDDVITNFEPQLPVVEDTKKAQFKAKIYYPYIEAVIKNLKERFPDVKLIDAFTIFDSSLITKSHEDVIEDASQKEKLEVYIIRVVWSDHTTQIVYRRYTDFFDFHYALIFNAFLPCLPQIKIHELFPEEAGTNNPSHRIIPFFPGKNLFQRINTRRFVSDRLEKIDQFCQELIHLPAKLSECREVLNFFEARPEDLNPPTKLDSEKRRRGVISQPIQLETYMAIDDFNKQQRNELSLHAGDNVEVIEKNDSGWWFVVVEGEQGWVPAAYLEKPGEENQINEDFQTIEVGNGQESYVTIQKYKAENDDEISLDNGVVVLVLKKNLDGWWFVRHEGREGWAPATYLKKTYDNTQTEHKSADTLTLNSTRSVLRSPMIRHKPPPRQGTIKKSLTRSKREKCEYFTIGRFQASLKEGISFEKGQQVQVMDKSTDGWWFVKIEEREGWAPSSYIEEKRRNQWTIDDTQVIKPGVSDITEVTSHHQSEITPAKQLEQARARLKNVSISVKTTQITDIDRNDNNITKLSHSSTNSGSSKQTKQDSMETVNDFPYIATANFSSKENFMLNIEEGMEVEVMKKECWLVKSRDGRIGWVPSCCLTKRN
uniref:Uncharacterized protein LOC100368807 n=1 Tax=Saccoglossus kowalevskii TaxID=10224 RepID=A0ABM0MSY6_SACKO|nr:PREDICTED: uncharacterized protein LOC100368807 [Saccoglossus kowalevskii]